MTENHRNFPNTLPSGWFQIGYSDEIRPGDVKPLKYFAKDLVMFRTEGGELTVLDAFCPHLGAHLGHGGKVKGNEIECPFMRGASVRMAGAWPCRTRSICHARRPCGAGTFERSQT